MLHLLPSPHTQSSIRKCCMFNEAGVHRKSHSCKHRYPKWKPRTKPAVLWWFNFHAYLIVYWTPFGLTCGTMPKVMFKYGAWMYGCLVYLTQGARSCLFTARSRHSETLPSIRPRMHLKQGLSPCHPLGNHHSGHGQHVAWKPSNRIANCQPGRVKKGRPPVSPNFGPHTNPTSRLRCAARASRVARRASRARAKTRSSSPSSKFAAGTWKPKPKGGGGASDFLGFLQMGGFWGST